MGNLLKPCGVLRRYRFSPYLHPSHRICGGKSPKALWGIETFYDGQKIDPHSLPVLGGKSPKALWGIETRATRAGRPGTRLPGGKSPKALWGIEILFLSPPPRPFGGGGCVGNLLKPCGVLRPAGFRQRAGEKRLAHTWRGKSPKALWGIMRDA